MVMAGCTNGDRVDEVRVGHVGQVGHGAVLVSRVRSVDDERSRGFMVRKKVSEKSFRESSQPYIFCWVFYIGTGPGSVLPRAPTTERCPGMCRFVFVALFGAAR